MFEHYIDLSAELCPMTFVRTALFLERLAPGALAVVCLKSGEPLVNVSRTALEHGHSIEGSRPVDDHQPDGTHYLFIRKKAG